MAGAARGIAEPIILAAQDDSDELELRMSSEGENALELPMSSRRVAGAARFSLMAHQHKS